MILLVALLAAPGGPAVRSDVVETRLEAFRGPGGVVDARVDVRVLVPARGATSLPFRLLEIYETRIESLSAFEGERALTVRVDPSHRPLLLGKVDLPSSEGLPGAESAAERVVSFRYVVNQMDGPAVTVPTVIVADGQGAARVGAFSGRLVFSETGERGDGGVLESFPSNGVEEADGGSYSWKLPLVPAFVSVGAPVVGDSSILGPLSRAGFSFWGLFAVCAAVAGLYATWMMRCERRSPS
jgi:hypothetical protein